MRNAKMKYKIFFLMMLFLTLLNNVSAYDVYEGEVESISYSQTNIDIGTTDTIDRVMDSIGIINPALAKDLKTVSVMIDIDAWDGTHDYEYLKSDVVYKDPGDNIAGTGYVYYWMMNTDSIPGYDKVYIKAYIDNGLTLAAPYYYVKMEGDIVSYLLIDKHSQMTLPGAYAQKTCLLGYGYWDDSMKTVDGYHSASHTTTFYNNYSYWYNEDLFTFELTRDVVNLSMIYINNQYEDLINETSYNSDITSVYSDDIVNHTWDIEIYDINTITHAFQIDFIPIPESLTPTLSTDKTTYNTSEQITISFTNIDEIEGYEIERLSLYILYPIIHESKDYDAKYMLHLLGDKRDETFTLNTSFLIPQNEYHLGICVDGDFHNIDDALIISDTFYVYDENEYLSTSCNPDGNCYTYNNNDIIIYYRINNNSDVIIKDNDGTTIQTYYNIIDEGEINYHIPNDENKLNSYPNWKIYLNNTGYETNYSTDVTVYWSLFTTPTPTPVYTVDIPDENVTEQIDQLKEESKPIFDLIYGLTTLVVDNPDYDNDNIVDEHEINNWFNSLIPLGILLLLIILYMGLKKRD